jgi:hypothetical protein
MGSAPSAKMRAISLQSNVWEAPTVYWLISFFGLLKIKEPSVDPATKWMTA